MEEVYSIHYLGDWWTKPWAVFKKVYYGERFFWQQVSKSYISKAWAIRFAERNGMKLSK
jgi:hypothetical protein